MSRAHQIINQLGLSPHPEGGWYRRTWAATSDSNAARPAATLIYFLLETSQRSHWHVVDADEMWLWHAGNPIALSLSPDDNGPAVITVLGPDVVGGQHAQAVVPAGHWQSAAPMAGEHDYTLVSCVVAPGFDFAGFTLAPPGWEPGA